jgi:hypothetical protein
MTKKSLRYPYSTGEEFDKMKNITVELSQQELNEILKAYHTIRIFWEKIISPNELYRDEFLKGLETANTEVKTGAFEEVRTFEDFIC